MRAYEKRLSNVLAWASFAGFAAPLLLLSLVFATWVPTIFNHYANEEPELVHIFPAVDDEYVLAFVEPAVSCDSWADENLVENIYVATINTPFGEQKIPHDGSPTNYELIERGLAQGAGEINLYECGVSHPQDRCEAIVDHCKQAERDSTKVVVHKAVFKLPSNEDADRQVSWVVVASGDYSFKSWLRTEQKLTFANFFAEYIDWAKSLLIPVGLICGLILSVLNYLMTGSFRLKPWVSVPDSDSA